MHGRRLDFVTGKPPDRGMSGLVGHSGFTSRMPDLTSMHYCEHERCMMALVVTCIAIVLCLTPRAARSR